MTEWRITTVEDCLDVMPLRTATKLQTRDYKTSGMYPIIDQGQALIAGWTDDVRGLIETDLPLVVFGDHTRAVKFVDFPFVRGADGTQVLKPKPGIAPLFFYYACRAVDLPSRGYNRHFMALKERKISIPSADEQHDIAFTLKLVDDALSLQDQQLKALESVKRTTMHALFTQGLNGERQKETAVGPVPESWDVVALGSTSSLSTGSTPSTKRREYYSGDVAFIRTAEIVNNRLTSAATHISREAVADYSLRVYPPGTVLMAMYGQGKTRGQVALLEISAATTQNAAAILPDDRMDAAFLWHYLLNNYDRLRGMGSLGHLSHLNLGYLRELCIGCPPVEEQRGIVAILDAIDNKIDLHRRKHSVFEDLLKTLLQKLMTGEIHVGDLNLSALAPTPVSGAAICAS